ncbi:MAG: hypothetical protein V2B14_03225 [bacterium]
MSDNINEKIISIFAKHKKKLSSDDDEKVIRSIDGFYYICIKKDENNKYLDEKKLTDKSFKYSYIVKVMVKHSEHPYIYSFKVPGEKIVEFLKLYVNGEREGQIIEIDKYYPNEFA